MNFHFKHITTSVLCFRLNKTFLPSIHVKMAKMKALITQEDHKVAVQETDVPNPAEGEILVKVHMYIHIVENQEQRD